MYYYKITEHIPGFVDVDRENYANICFTLRNVFRLPWIKSIASQTGFTRWSISGHCDKNGRLLLSAHYTDKTYFVKAFIKLKCNNFVKISDNCLLDVNAVRKAEF